MLKHPPATGELQLSLCFPSGFEDTRRHHKTSTDEQDPHDDRTAISPNQGGCYDGLISL